MFSNGPLDFFYAAHNQMDNKRAAARPSSEGVFIIEVVSKVALTR